MLDRSLALRLKTQIVAASGEDSSLLSVLFFITRGAGGRMMTMTLALFF
jgi:hypothetical protein